MSEPVVIFDHVYKKFSRGEHHTSLRDFIPAMAARMWPFKKRKPEEAATLEKEEFWAVKDVSFALKRGETMGIIGPNGSGKSTTLKLLSGIIRADRGRFAVKGRLSALIEVGAGFHPDLTGRENVYLNGCILGMTRKEVASKFNEIVEFAGVEEFIDTPIKRYSSGMAVRLGFAIAAHIDPDVLLVDEVLAVGDAEFRNRCHDRMLRMRKNGVTMILVSHNLNEVRNLCENTISMFRGEKIEDGPTQRVLEKYYHTISLKIKAQQDSEAAKSKAPDDKGPVRLTDVTFLDEAGNPCEIFMTGKPMTLRIGYEAKEPAPGAHVRAEMVWATDDYLATVFNTHADGVDLGTLSGKGFLDLKINALMFEPNVYAMRISISDGTHASWSVLPRARFVVSEELLVPGVFALEHTWNVLPGGAPPTSRSEAAAERNGPEIGGPMGVGQAPGGVSGKDAAHAAA